MNVGNNDINTMVDITLIWDKLPRSSKITLHSYLTAYKPKKDDAMLHNIIRYIDFPNNKKMDTFNILLSKLIVANYIEDSYGPIFNHNCNNKNNQNSDIDSDEIIDVDDIID